MIKYITEKERDINNNIISYYVILKLKNSLPLHFIYECGEESWSIPCKQNKWILHKDDGPAIINGNGISTNANYWYYYGIKAINKKQFYDYNWRKKIEIERFL